MTENVTLDSGGCVTLKDYIERILDERDKTLVLTAKNLEHRLETLNQLRADVIKDRDQFVSDAVYKEMHSALVNRVTAVEKMQSRMVGVGIALVAGAGLIGAVLTHLFKP